MKRYLHRTFSTFCRIGLTIGCLFLIPTFAQQTNNGFAGAGVSIAFQNGGPEVAGQGVSIAFQNASNDVIGQGVSIAFAENINADVAVTIAASANPVSIKGSLAYTITVTNNGPSQEAGFTVTDNLPDGVTFGSVSSSQGTCTGTRKISCTLGSILQNAKATVTLVVFPVKSGEVTNTANVTTNGIDPNPTNNMAAITTTILPDLAPLGKGELYGAINKSWPTIVLTHGLSSKSDKPRVPDSLWIGNNPDENARGASTLLSGKLKELNRDVNVLQFVWDEAFQVDGTVPVRSEYIAARNGAQNAGRLLANLLLEKLGNDYNKEIHFIGHSLGTVVSTYAAGDFLGKALRVTKAQFTALDRPHYVHRIPGTTSLTDPDKFDRDYGFNSDFFAETLKYYLASRSTLKLSIDNYFTYTRPEGVGAPANPAEGILFYNHPELVAPDDVGGKFFDNENTAGYNNAHSGVQQWYRLTIKPELYKDIFGNPICNEAKFNKPTLWDKSLNPCQIGWYWSVNGPNPAAFPGISNVVSPIKSMDKTLAVSGYNNIQGCQTQESSFSCQKSTTAIAALNNKASANASSTTPSANAFATINVDLPVGTNYLTFEYKFSNIGDGDYAAVLIDDNAIWSLAGANFTGSDFVNSGPIPIGGYKDAITLTMALYGTGATNTKVEFRNFAGIAVNSPPVFEQLGNYTVTTGNLLTVDAVAKDENGDSITFSISGAPAGATIDPTTGKFSWTPSTSQFGLFSFKVRATDSSVDQLFSEQTVTMLVLDTAGYEADVTPRPSGNKNGTVTIADWVQLGRFAAGIDTPEIGSEFQRADCAPKATFGDGKISIADWVQAGRYAAGLDSVATVAGAFAPSDSIFAANSLDTKPEAVRTIRANNATFLRGQIGNVQIAFDTQGNENAVSFSMNYDPRMMSFLDATVGNGANGAALQVNTSQVANGRIGFALALPVGQQFPTGTRDLLNLRFIPVGGDGDVSTNISFSDQLLTREIVDTFATPLGQTSFVGGTINISGKAVATVSAANYVGGEQAAESIVSAFGSQLAAFAQAAPSLPLPISLGGSQVIVKDGKGVERFAPLFYASPAQLNFQIPAGTAEGVATLTIFSGTGITSTGIITIGKVAPALFSADSSGTGFAAGSALMVRADGSRTDKGLASYDTATSKFIVQPIDLGGSGDQVYLTLYGTGFKNRSDLANVKVKIGGIDTPIEYAGAQGFFAGLDQINVRVPQSLAGRGMVNVELIVEGKIGNAVAVMIK